MEIKKQQKNNKRKGEELKVLQLKPKNQSRREETRRQNEKKNTPHIRYSSQLSETITKQLFWIEDIFYTSEKNQFRPSDVNYYYCRYIMGHWWSMVGKTKGKRDIFFFKWDNLYIITFLKCL